MIIERFKLDEPFATNQIDKWHLSRKSYDIFYKNQYLHFIATKHY